MGKASLRSWLSILQKLWIVIVESMVCANDVPYGTTLISIGGAELLFFVVGSIEKARR